MNWSKFRAGKATEQSASSITAAMSKNTIDTNCILSRTDMRDDGCGEIG